MDLQNNKIGRILFLEILGQNEAKMIVFLQKKLQTARKLDKIEQIDEHNNELVYVSE